MPVPKVVEADCWPFGAVYAGGKPLPGQVLVLSLFSDCACCYRIKSTDTSGKQPCGTVGSQTALGNQIWEIKGLLPTTLEQCELTCTCKASIDVNVAF